jgi:PKD repeat protein
LAALVLSLALAGCAGGDDDGGGVSASQSQSGAQGNSTALTAVIRVLANGTLATPSNGSIPVDAGVELTFDGANSTGPIVEYAWDFGDNATGTDETETHAYAAGGLYDVTLTVKGLGNASANATVRLEVAAETSGASLGVEAFTFEGDLPLSNPNSCTNQGVDCQDHVVTIVGERNGTAAMANNVTIVLDGSGAAAVYMQLFWRSPDGTVLAQTGADDLDYTLTYAGDMPPGDYVVRVRLFVGAQASYTVAGAVAYVSV